MANSSSFTLNTQIDKLSTLAKDLNLTSWDDYKSAYVVGKFNDDMDSAMQYVREIAYSDKVLEAYYGTTS